MKSRVGSWWGAAPGSEAHQVQPLALPQPTSKNHSVQVLDLRLRNHNPDAGLGRASASAWGVRRGSRGQRQQGAWDRATRDRGGATLQLDLALRLCASQGVSALLLWRPRSPWLEGRKLGEKDTVISAASITLTAWTKGREL